MLIERPVLIESAGGQLIGVVHEPQVQPFSREQKFSGNLPEVAEKSDSFVSKPGILLLHGFTGNKLESHRIFVNTARRLAQAGYYTLRFDFRGSGDSSGDFRDMTVTGEVEDAVNAYRWFSENTPVQPEKIAVLGFSLGGCVAAYTAAQVNPAALVLWAPVAEPLKIFTRTESFESMLEHSQATGYIDLNGWPLGRGFIQELPKLDPLSAVGKYTGPALIMHGQEDLSVPVENGRLYYDHLPTADKEMHVIADAGHTFNKIEWEDALTGQTVAWMQKKVK